MYTSFDFSKQDDYAIANQPIVPVNLDLENRSVNLWLLFFANCSKCPKIYFSQLSGKTVVNENIPIKSAVVDYENSGFSLLEERCIKKFDYLRLSFNFLPNFVEVRIRMKDSLANDILRINTTNSLFLVVKSEEIFSPDLESCLFALLPRPNFISFLDALKAGKNIMTFYGKSGCERPSSAFILRAVPLLNKPSLKTVNTRFPLGDRIWEPPLCFSCMDSQIEVVIHKCNHAMFCDRCYQTYLARERERLATICSNKKNEDIDFVRCPNCRCRIQSVGRIWFVTKKCLLCGCTNLDTVAGGASGCGCVFGCYEEAKKLLREPSPRCPYCDNPIIKLVRVYFQGETFNQ